MSIPRNMMGTRVPWIAAAVLCAVSAAAQTTAPLDWKSCVRSAVRSNPELAAARHDIAGAEANLDSARGGRWPQVKASGSARRSGRETDANGESYSAGLSVSQLLFDGGKTGHEVARADTQVALSQIEYQVLSADVRYQLRAAYIDLLRAQRQVAISAGILKRREQSTRLISLRYDAGREHRGSLLTAEAKEAEARLDHTQAVRGVDVARRALAVMMGATNAAGLQAAGDLAAGLPPARPDFVRLAGLTPTAARLDFGSVSASESLEAAKAGRWPTVQVSAEAGRSGDWPPEEDAWSASLGISLPVFEGGRRSATIRQAREELSAVDEKNRSGRNALVQSLESRWVAFQDAAARVEIRRKYQEAAEERARIAEAQYSGGVILFDNWIIIEDEYAQAEKALLSAQADAMTAEAGWVRSLGGTLEDENP